MGCYVHRKICSVQYLLVLVLFVSYNMHESVLLNTYIVAIYNQL